MAVIAGYRGDILDLAARQIRTDETFRRLTNYANIQFSFCMWGLVPGSITDEASPFNECSHAYLAATQAVLLRMRATPDPHPSVDALVSRIDMDMLRNRASLMLCRYSDENFDTGEVISPNWAGVLSHPTSLATFAGLALVLAASVAAVAACTARSTDRREDS